MRQIGLAALAVVLIGLGMYGLNAHIEYSGWVLFVGCLAVLGWV